MSLQDLEELEEEYPYLAGHTYTRVERSFACIFCGCFREDHPEERQGNLEPVSEFEAQEMLRRIDREISLDIRSDPIDDPLDRVCGDSLASDGICINDDCQTHSERNIG